MSKLKVGDLVRVVAEAGGRYVGKLDTIESVLLSTTSGMVLGLAKKAYYLKNCHLEYEEGKRLYFEDHELELVKEFYWLKKN